MDSLNPAELLKGLTNVQRLIGIALVLTALLGYVWITTEDELPAIQQQGESQGENSNVNNSISF